MLHSFRRFWLFLSPLVLISFILPWLYVLLLLFYHYRPAGIFLSLSCPINSFLITFHLCLIRCFCSRKYENFLLYAIAVIYKSVLIVPAAPTLPRISGEPSQYINGFDDIHSSFCSTSSCDSDMLWLKCVFLCIKSGARLFCAFYSIHTNL